MSAPGPDVSRVEVEMSTGWGTSHPELMVKSIVDFQLNHPVKDWCHTIDLSRIGFVSLIAHRRK